MENSQGTLNLNENYKKNQMREKKKVGKSTFGASKLFPFIQNISEKQKHWVAGFIEGEGSTNISFKKQKNMKIGLRPCASFSVTQHCTRVKSLEIVQTTLGGIGRIYPKPGKTQVMVYEVTKISHLHTIIIPFLEKYNYLSSRKTELLTFKIVVEQMVSKNHCTIKGLKDIINIVFLNALNSSNRKFTKEELLSFIKNF